MYAYQCRLYSISAYTGKHNYVSLLLFRKVISCACSNNNEQLMIAASPTPSLRIQENPRNTLYCSPIHPTVFSFYDRPFSCLVLPLSLFTSFSKSWSYTPVLKSPPILIFTFQSQLLSTGSFCAIKNTTLNI